MRDSSPSFRRPPALRPGGVIGVAAPAGAVDEGRLARGVAALRGLGYEVRVGESALLRDRFTAGPVPLRLADLQGFLDDDSVSAILCARGGAGASWLLPHLRIPAEPKLLIGYSDITFLHLALQREGWITLHGPMVAHELSSGLLDAPSFEAAAVTGAPVVVEGSPLVSLVSGHATGRLLGGCLSILAAAAGTPWALAPDPAGTILFLEDVEERPYRIDRLLFQLRETGAFRSVTGIVFGEMKGCHMPGGAGYRLEEVVLGALAGLDVPVAFGLPSGHTSGPNITLPFGVRAELTCGTGARLSTLEASVS